MTGPGTRSLAAPEALAPIPGYLVSGVEPEPVAGYESRRRDDEIEQ